MKKITINQAVKAEGLDKEWPKIKVKIIKILSDNKEDGAVVINIIGDGLMKKLNMKYRKKDKTTDVLSFNINSDGILGELYISYPKLIKQAKEYCVTIGQELDRLTIHGILHLLGYTHKEMGDYAS
jgi:probable rRNA maturation factor